MTIPRFSVPATKPESVIDHLARGKRHWKPGYSACELASAWIGANDIPATVRVVLESCPDYAGCRLVDGFFERSVDLRTRGRPSQTDLMLVVAGSRGLSIIGVEGKVNESFGPIVSEWLDASKDRDESGKPARLNALCRTLGLDGRKVGGLRYQLLHRTVSAIYEAEHYLASHTLMLVHSFSADLTGFGDFQHFASVLDLAIDRPNAISPARTLGTMSLRLGWVADKPRLQ